MAARSDAVSLPEPRSVGELADRLQRPGSVALVLPRLALPYLQVAEALAALGAPATRDALVRLLGVADEEGAPRLDAALEVLADHALVWSDGNGTLHMAAPLRQAWEAPLGLDPPVSELLAGVTSEELRGMLAALGVKPPGTKQRRLTDLVDHHSDPDRVTAAVARAPAATRDLLERLADPEFRRRQSVMFGAPGPGAGPGARWALDRGLLVQDRHRYGPARMPAQVALALRGPDWRAPFEPVPPLARLLPVTTEEVEREAAAAVTAFAAHAFSVLSVCAAKPPVRLKSGGVGVRELVRIGKAAQCDETVLRVVLETAYAAGLLAREGDLVPVTEAYDAWAELEPGERIPLLLRTWWSLPLTPAQTRDEEGKSAPALAGTPPCNGCVQARHGLLAAAANLPADRGARQASEDLGPLVAWHRPLADQLPQDTTPFATVIREAELLGVLARGALSGIGAALLADDAEELLACTRRLLPAATETALIGADLTAVATGTPSARLTALLDSVADREAGGTASVWRFSPGSVRRALDTGRSPDGITADLTAVAAGPLPQPLSYLIADTARRHGRIRLAPAACVIHGEEPALLAELTVHRKLAGLGLRQLAPTVLVSRTSLDKTLAALRAEGYAPVAETADGTVRIEKAEQHRAAAPVPSPRVARGTVGAQRPAARMKRGRESADGLRALAVRLRESPATSPAPDPDNGVPFGTDTEEIIAGYASALSLADVRQLAHAVDAGQAITIEYVAASGSHTVRSLSDLDLDPPYLQAWCHLRNDERVFTLSRVQSVMPAQDSG
ncbi:helicase-associated domain-containing protein [Streptomyces scopuliridis]|uniref:Helicase-associated domain-containing protein n=1 Tax=Streptomyces scopuliridis TaxID=452529 RepID=A0ACD4ZMK4_9ACTN|nr:helicase-associated domain-containing protein [Streptomyces scopuliridis]WSB99228.1 helicase-associated domain-containing protein [Streptomyces scopuliridis]WSC07071.1 helicase-associated domain-containing protein [Streptomyces scopuliridis]